MGVDQAVIGELERQRIGLGPRVKLILIYLGLTPAAQFEILGDFYNYNSGRVVNSPAVIDDEVVTAVKRTGLPHRIEPKDAYYEEGRSRHLVWLANKIPMTRIRYQPVYVAQTPELLEELLHADPWRDHKKYGKLMGYPETAIMAFVGELERHDNCPSELDTSINPVIDLVLSRARWRDELQVLRGWQDTIRTHAPNLYRELLQNRIR